MRNLNPNPAPWLLLTATAMLFVGARAEAAYPTKVLTAAEKGNKFDINFQVGWEMTNQNATINREWIQDGRATEVRELDWKRASQRMILDFRVGLFHDLELHIGAPIVFFEDTDINFAEGVNDALSTVWGNNTNADDPGYGGNGDSTLPDNTFGAPPKYPVTEVPAKRERAGFGDMTFGLAWSPLVDAKDEGYPTLTLRGDIIAPTGSVRKPEDLEALEGAGGGGIGLGLTQFDLSIGVSKRMSLGAPSFDPYMLFGARLPVASGSQKSRGMNPPFLGRFTVGSELVVYENADNHMKYGFDVSFTTTYSGEARFYSELSDFLPNFDQTKVDVVNRPQQAIEYGDYDNPSNYAFQIDGITCGKVDGTPCGELNQVDEFLSLKGNITAHLQFAEYFLLRAGFSLQHNTDHFITNERVGEDTDDPARVAEDPNGDFIGRVNPSNLDGEDERSPYFDPRYDTIGRRFRVTGLVSYTVFIAAIATF